MYSRRQLFASIFSITAVWINSQTYENEYGDDYGTEWLYFVDDNGSTHVMNFSTIPGDSRGMFFGDAYFTLYTRRNFGNPEELMIPENGSPIQSKYFNSSNNLKIVTHGWMSSDSTQWLQNIRDAYLKQYDYNVITVDWSELAHNPTYVWPALSTRFVGKQVAKLVSSLMQSYDMQGSNVHLIGHSLGAQVMGYAGMFSEQKIYRITGLVPLEDISSTSIFSLLTINHNFLSAARGSECIICMDLLHIRHGLDPARPLFELPYMPSDFRLEQSDADFVDIIHTCGGVLGYRMSHGHADFYPNKGRARQPGCEGPQMMIEGCSHGKSCEFFGESIDSNPPFTAYPCESWRSFESGDCKSSCTQMGDPVSTDSRGDYYLHTRNESRYAMGDEQNQSS